MLESIQQAASLAVNLGWFMSLALFVPLWGPRIVFPPPISPPVAALSFCLLDLAGLIPAALIAFVISTAHPQWVPPAWVHGTTLAGSLLGIMLWVQSIRFANRYDIVTNSSRLLVIGLVYPLSIFSVAYVLTAVLALISSVLKFEPAAVPYIIVFVLSLVFWLFVAAGIRRLFSRITGIALRHENT